MMASPSPSPRSLDPISKWLQHVDNQLTPGEGVEFLKLALYPFLRIEYAVAQGLKTPSTVYTFLLEKCFKHDKEKSLQWFVHALKLLSGDLRGVYLVECLSQYEISCPSAPKEMDAEKKFFECITTIGRKARGHNLEEVLKWRFAKRRFLSVNPDHLAHLPDLFIRLVQEQIISPTKTHHLAKTLQKSGSIVASQCLFYLNEYHKSVGIPEIESIKGANREQFPPTTSFEESTDVSSDPSTTSRRLNINVMLTKHREYQQGRGDSKLTAEGDESLKTLAHDNESDRKSTSESDVSSEDEDQNSSTSSEERQLRSSSGTRRLGQKRALYVSWTVVILILLLLSGLLCGIIWKNLFTPIKFDGNITIYEETAVVIGELDQFYHRQVNLVSQPGIPLGDHTVEIYHFNSSCEKLPKLQSILPWHKSTVSNNQNFTHHYMLPGSTFYYTIAPVNLDAPDYDIVKGYVYITRGPEVNEFNSATCQSPDCTIVYHKPFKDNLSCSSVLVLYLNTNTHLH